MRPLKPKRCAETVPSRISPAAMENVWSATATSRVYVKSSIERAVHAGTDQLEVGMRQDRADRVAAHHPRGPLDDAEGPISSTYGSPLPAPAGYI
jgi:hypothetical protein